MMEAGELPAGLDTSRISLESPKTAEHGDLSTNAALVLARGARCKPREIAERLAEGMRGWPETEAVEIAGPGFVNLRLTPSFWRQRLGEMLDAGDDYGRGDIGKGRRINVEYVSANPTGPLHVGHGRGAVVGDAIASLLEKVGYEVSREYYVNDGGQQITQLVYAAYFRYLEALGAKGDEAAFRAFFPGKEWEYRGDYLKSVGQALKEKYGESLAERNEQTGEWAPRPVADWFETVREATLEAMLGLIRDDLKALGIGHAAFVHERHIVESGLMERVEAILKERDLLYTGRLEPPKGKLPDDWESREQLLFRATAFGDDVDRPLKKSDGGWTYFATDIAYHLDKFQRGFNGMIDVWGADHKGYVKRMKAAVEAVTAGQAALDVRICNLVHLLRAGKPVKMSKRMGSFVTLREVIDEVGKDVVRFIMLTRTNEAALDFDLERVTEQSKDNPVFYVQYAHARARSARRRAAAQFPGVDFSAQALRSADLACLADAGELGLIKHLAEWPRIVEMAAAAHEPHRIAFYLYDLASRFHVHWNRGNDEPRLRLVVPSDKALSAARLALVEGVALVIASGLRIFGVEPVEEMR
jgi:arginyl-tRNA synthetase